MPWTERLRNVFRRDRVDADILRYHMPGLMLEDIYRQLDSHEAGGRIDNGR